MSIIWIILIGFVAGILRGLGFNLHTNHRAQHEHHRGEKVVDLHYGLFSFDQEVHQARANTHAS